MTINELLQNGFEVRVKTGYIEDQFIRDTCTIRVEVEKDGIKGYGYREIQEDVLDSMDITINVVERLLPLAINNYEKNERLIKTKSEIT